VVFCPGWRPIIVSLPLATFAVTIHTEGKIVENSIAIKDIETIETILIINSIYLMSSRKFDYLSDKIYIEEFYRMLPLNVFHIINFILTIKEID
jgi:hypothetical protein